MFYFICKKELLQNILDRRFLFAVALCSIIFPLSFHLMIKNYSSMVDLYRVNSALSAESQVLGKVLVPAVPPPSPTYIFAYGSTSGLSRVIYINRNTDLWVTKKISADIKREQKDLALAYFPPPDFLFLIRIVLTITAVMLACYLICAEKEAGTLRLMLASGVTRNTVLLAKWTGCFLVIFAIFTLFYLIGLIQLALAPQINLVTEHWIRMLLMGLVSLLFLGIFVNLGLLISTRTSSSHLSTITSLLSWLVLVLIIPSLAVQIAKRVYQVPTTQELQDRRLEIEEDLRSRSQNNPGRRPRREDIKRVNRQIRARLDALDEDYMNRVFTQISIAQGLASISPAMAYSKCIMSIAGTGTADERNYYAQLKRYARWLSDYDKSSRELLEEKNMDGLPPFKYVPHRLGHALKNIAVDLSILILQFGASMLISFISFARYDVR